MNQQENEGLLVCGPPWEGQPIHNTGTAKCATCGAIIIYNTQALETVKRRHTSVRLVCNDCIDIITDEEPFNLFGVVGKTVFEDLEQFRKEAKKSRLSNGGRE